MQIRHHHQASKPHAWRSQRARSIRVIATHASGRHQCSASDGSSSVDAAAARHCSSSSNIAASVAPSRRSLLLLTPTAITAAAIALPLPRAARAADGGAGPVTPSPEVAAAVSKALEKVITRPKAPVALRLAYHDAGTFSKRAGDGGPNASIRFELDRPENFGLKRGWRLIEEASQLLRGTPAEGAVSYADLIAWAGARAVAVTGGPTISDLGVGRADASGPDPEGRLAGEASDAAALVRNFEEKGFSVRELVALSGAHTLGGKGFGDPVAFDNAYYAALLAKPWLKPNDPMASHIGLPSDHALPEDARCLAVIEEYASDEAAFRRDFSAAYARMVTLGARWA